MRSKLARSSPFDGLRSGSELCLPGVRSPGQRLKRASLRAQPVTSARRIDAHAHRGESITSIGRIGCCRRCAWRVRTEPTRTPCGCMVGSAFAQYALPPTDPRARRFFKSLTAADCVTFGPRTCSRRGLWTITADKHFSRSAARSAITSRPVTIGRKLGPVKYNSELPWSVTPVAFIRSARKSTCRASCRR